MGKIRRYLRGSSPNIYKVVGFVIKKATKYGYVPHVTKIANEQPLRFSAALAMVSTIEGTIYETMKRYLDEKPAQYSVLGYRFTKPNNENSNEFRTKIQLSVNEKPLNVMTILNEMVRVAM